MEALKMERPMDSWNDDRLDEMSRRMDEGFKEMREGFARIDQRFEKMVTRDEMKELVGAINARSDRIENRLDRMYYGCIALIVLLVGNSIANSFLA
jgi:hypothetical protein